VGRSCLLLPGRQGRAGREGGRIGRGLSQQSGDIAYARTQRNRRQGRWAETRIRERQCRLLPYTSMAGSGDKLLRPCFWNDIRNGGSLPRAAAHAVASFAFTVPGLRSSLKTLMSLYLLPTAAVSGRHSPGTSTTGRGFIIALLLSPKARGPHAEPYALRLGRSGGGPFGRWHLYCANASYRHGREGSEWRNMAYSLHALTLHSEDVKRPQ